jgi:hypothetical protein
VSHHRLALRACFAALFAAITGCGDAPTGSTLSRLSPLGRAPLADVSAAASTALANQGAPNLCLTVSGTGPGASASLQSCSGTSTQSWSVPSAPGAFRLNATGACLDAFGGASSAGDLIGIWSCHGGSNQTYTLTSTGELRVANGLCVGPKGDATASTLLVLQTCTGAAAQKWTAGGASAPTPALPTARFSGQLANSASTGLCLTANVSGAVTGLQGCASSSVQTWSVPGAGTAGTVTLLANGQCLDAFGGTSNVGDGVGLWSCHGGSNQNYTLTAAGELRVSNGLCVGPVSGAAVSGATLQLQPCTGAMSQRWSATASAAPAPTPRCRLRRCRPRASRGSSPTARRRGSA